MRRENKLYDHKQTTNAEENVEKTTSSIEAVYTDIIFVNISWLESTKTLQFSQNTIAS